MNYTKEEKWQKAYEMREGGATFADIGRHFGVGRDQAVTYCAKHYKLKTEKFMPGVSERAKNCIKCELSSRGYDWEKVSDSDLIEIFSDSEDFVGIPNFGKKSIQEVCDYLAIKTPNSPGKEKYTRDAVAHLEAKGYKVTPPENGDDQ